MYKACERRRDAKDLRKQNRRSALLLRVISCLFQDASAVRVDDPVALQVVHEDEGLPAQRAAVGPLAAVRPLVHPQAALLREPLAALAAAVRLLARVRPVVNAEVRRALEALPAHGAPEGPLPLVALLVQLELVQAAERLAAVRAGVAAGRAGGGPVGVEAAGRPGCGVPLRVDLLLRAVRRRPGLKAGRLRAVAVVDPVARPLGGRLRGAGRLGGAGRGVRVGVVRKGVGILLHHAGEVGEAGVDVAAFDDGRPQLVLSFVHGEVGGELRLLPGAVQAATPAERRSVLLLLRLHGELMADGDVPRVQVAGLRAARLAALLQPLALSGVGRSAVSCSGACGRPAD